MNRATQELIVVFDSKCLLCNGWVQFLLRHDKAGVISFASMQGETGKNLLIDHGLPTENLDTLLVLQGGTSWLHTEAILKVLTTLGWPWKFANSVRICPTRIRNAIYRVVARNRYRIFGRTESCLLPNPEVRHRFLD